MSNWHVEKVAELTALLLEKDQELRGLRVRIAELEGARATACEIEVSKSWPFSARAAVEKLQALIAAQADELKHLRKDLATSQTISRDMLAAAGKGISLAVADELRRMRSDGLVSAAVVDGVETWKLTEVGKQGMREP